MSVTIDSHDIQLSTMIMSNLCREALAALRAKEEYQRRHMAGETEQAKRELAKLAEVRARREAARLKREAGSTDGKQLFLTFPPHSFKISRRRC